MKASKEKKIKKKNAQNSLFDIKSWISRNREKMARNGERVGEISQPPPQPQPPPPPARASSGGRLRNRADPLLVVCRCYSVLTSLTALLCLAVNVLSAIRSFKNGSDVRVCSFVRRFIFALMSFLVFYAIYLFYFINFRYLTGYFGVMRL